MERKPEEPIRVVKADLRYRKWLFRVYALLLACGVAFVVFAVPYLRVQSRHLSFVASEIILIGFLLSFCVPAWYLVSMGRRMRRHSQFPYPGMKVIHDTKVISGKKALLRGRLFIYFGCFACALAILGSISVHRSFQKLNSELMKIFHSRAQ